MDTRKGKRARETTAKGRRRKRKRKKHGFEGDSVHYKNLLDIAEKYTERINALISTPLGSYYRELVDYDPFVFGIAGTKKLLSFGEQVLKNHYQDLFSNERLVALLEDDEEEKLAEIKELLRTLPKMDCYTNMVKLMLGDSSFRKDLVPADQHHAVWFNLVNIIGDYNTVEWYKQLSVLIDKRKEEIEVMQHMQAYADIFSLEDVDVLCRLLVDAHMTDTPKHANAPVNPLLRTTIEQRISLSPIPEEKLEELWQYQAHIEAHLPPTHPWCTHGVPFFLLCHPKFDVRILSEAWETQDARNEMVYDPKTQRIGEFRNVKFNFMYAQHMTACLRMERGLGIPRDAVKCDEYLWGYQYSVGYNGADATMWELVAQDPCVPHLNSQTRLLDERMENMRKVEQAFRVMEREHVLMSSIPHIRSTEMKLATLLLDMGLMRYAMDRYRSSAHPLLGMEILVSDFVVLLTYEKRHISHVCLNVVPGLKERCYKGCTPSGHYEYKKAETIESLLETQDCVRCTQMYLCAVQMCGVSVPRNRYYEISEHIQYVPLDSVLAYNQAIIKPVDGALATCIYKSFAEMDRVFLSLYECNRLHCVSTTSKMLFGIIVNSFGLGQSGATTKTTMDKITAQWHLNQHYTQRIPGTPESFILDVGNDAGFHRVVSLLDSVSNWEQEQVFQKQWIMEFAGSAAHGYGAMIDFLTRWWQIVVGHSIFECTSDGYYIFASRGSACDLCETDHECKLRKFPSHFARVIVKCLVWEGNFKIPVPLHPRLLAWLYVCMAVNTNNSNALYDNITLEDYEKIFKDVIPEDSCLHQSVINVQNLENVWCPAKNRPYYTTYKWKACKVLHDVYQSPCVLSNIAGRKGPKKGMPCSYLALCRDREGGEQHQDMWVFPDQTRIFARQMKLCYQNSLLKSIPVHDGFFSFMRGHFEALGLVRNKGHYSVSYKHFCERMCVAQTRVTAPIVNSKLWVSAETKRITKDKIEERLEEWLSGLSEQKLKGFLKLVTGQPVPNDRIKVVVKTGDYFSVSVCMRTISIPDAYFLDPSMSFAVYMNFMIQRDLITHDFNNE